VTQADVIVGCGDAVKGLGLGPGQGGVLDTLLSIDGRAGNLKGIKEWKGEQIRELAGAHRMDE
jgi:hypothetical protein